MQKKYVQYGCGLAAPKEWLNYDASPTLILQRLPFIGYLIKSKLNVIFPDNVMFGDIIKGLPIEKDSVDGLYCSHTLEHLSLEDFRTALFNSLKILKPGGVFRCIVPDLEFSARSYISQLDKNVKLASLEFMNSTMLGRKIRPKGLKGIISLLFGNYYHYWMWDRNSLVLELEGIGFRNVRICEFDDCSDHMFSFVEDPRRFENAVAIECYK
jgi:hypothetical protein